MDDHEPTEEHSTSWLLAELAFFCVLLALSSEVMILSASEMAERLEVPRVLLL